MTRTDPPAGERLVVKYGVVTLANGQRIKQHSMFDAEYILWPCRTYGSPRVRWALRDWPDDGTMVPTHGAGVDLATAARNVAANRKLRLAVAAWED